VIITKTKKKKKINRLCIVNPKPNEWQIAWVTEKLANGKILMMKNTEIDTTLENIEKGYTQIQNYFNTEIRISKPTIKNIHGQMNFLQIRR
jgi:hypothetical protein